MTDFALRSEMHVIFSGYLELLAVGDAATQTYTNNRRSFRLFEDFLSSRQLEPTDIKLGDLGDWLKELREHYKNSTIIRHGISVRAAYQLAYEQGVIGSNPTAGLAKLLPTAHYRLPEIMTASELRRVCAALETELEEMVLHLLLWTGCRAMELRPLRWQPWHGSYVDFEHDQLVILGKGGKIRFVPLHPILRRRLEMWQLEHGEQHCVIESSRGRQLSHTWWTKQVTGLLERAGLSFEKKSHLFRKTLNTNLSRQNVPERVLDALFGWAPTTVRTKHYSGVASTEVRDAILLAYSDDPIVPDQTQTTFRAANLLPARSAAEAVPHATSSVVPRQEPNNDATEVLLRQCRALEHVLGRVTIAVASLTEDGASRKQKHPRRKIASDTPPRSAMSSAGRPAPTARPFACQR